jgi:hypothetical protein
MSALGIIDGLKFPLEVDGWILDDDDMLLQAMLQDNIYHPELVWEDPGNREYSGLYRVRDYQYVMNRAEGNYIGFACARSVGKTERQRIHASTHVFRRIRENLLITAPELIHLLPLTDAIEDQIMDSRITREMLDDRGQKTGFSHRPFQANFIDGTKIVGRIPGLKGTRVKGQHQPDLMVEEAQDYPEPGWIEVHETVMKDRPDFQYHFYGVHSGNRASTFYRHTSSGNFEIIQVTAIMRPGWSKAEKETAKSIYGGTSSPDYRRNILGEPGSAASAYFVLARLFACMDQDRESDYNTLEYASQELAAEDIDELLNEADRGDQGALTKIMMNVMDLPTGHRAVWGGMDVGLAQSPTVISLWAQKQVNKIERLSLFRRFTLSRLRTNQILAAWAAIGKTYGTNLRGFGIDSTGLGFPILQQMQDARAGEEVGQVPQHLIDVTRGYFFNAKVPVDVNKEQVTDDGRGNLRDGFGNIVKEEVDPFTGEKRYVTMMPMIEASTRYLRDFVDDTYLRLPFDPEVARDMQAETKQRVERLAGVKTKPDAFHILDAFRAMAMVFKSERIEQALKWDEPEDVLDMAL